MDAWCQELCDFTDPRILAVTGRDEVALVYVAEIRGRLVEFVDALDPRFARHEKWVVIVSSQFGCPVGCRMCDAGRWYQGNLTAEEILWQVDQVVDSRCADRVIPTKKFKVQFARMGEPSLNQNTLRALLELRHRYHAPGLIACLTTVAPAAANDYFENLLQIKRALYSGGAFQLQFSVNTTHDGLRDYLMPIKRWSLEEIATYGSRFYEPGDRRGVLNFALAEGWPLDTDRIANLFDPEKFVIKITPLNPTSMSEREGFRTLLAPERENTCDFVANALRDKGFEVVISIGTAEEIAIRSNCGQVVIATGYKL